MKYIPSIALMSGRLTSDDGATSAQIPPPSVGHSDLLWSLWRLGVKRVIAQESDVPALQHAARHLEPPPPPPNYQEPLLTALVEAHQHKLNTAPLSHLAWGREIEVSAPPRTPLEFEGVHLSFHDELIGIADSLLIHYGPSRFEVSGYHPPISSLSVPLGDEVSALVLFRTTATSRRGQPNKPQSPHSLETGVIHISAQGLLLKGPWWPRLKS